MAHIIARRISSNEAQAAEAAGAIEATGAQVVSIIYMPITTPFIPAGFLAFVRLGGEVTERQIDETIATASKKR